MQYGVSAVTTAYTPTNHKGWTTRVAAVCSVVRGTPAAYRAVARTAHTAVTPTAGRNSRASRPRSQSPGVVPRPVARRKDSTEA